MVFLVYKRYKWIEIKQLNNDDRKTKLFSVHPIGSIAILGFIKWFGRWRKYAFFPSPDTAYEPDCLRDIADFCQTETTEHKKNWVKP